ARARARARLVRVPAGETGAGARTRLPGAGRNGPEPSWARRAWIWGPRVRTLVCRPRIRRAGAGTDGGTVGGIPAGHASVLGMEARRLALGFGSGRLAHGEAGAWRCPGLSRALVTVRRHPA